ncbi:hypothetical protein NW840_12515 [Synechococcus sp. R5-13]|uniref:hypothetical protein n=1 Tax=Synechococcus sp. R5-13 TaxID=2291953 RepID=UPI0039C36FD2
MKCVEESHNKRVYQESSVGFLGSLATFVFICFFAFIPFMALSSIWSSQGERRFTCFRVDQSTVNCEVSFQPFLPLPSQTTLHIDVRGAAVKTEIVEDDDGERTERYYVTLEKPTGETPAWLAFGESEAQELARRVDSFVNSTESRLLIDIDRFHLLELVFAILYSLLPGLFLALLLWVGALMLKVSFWCRRLTFDRSRYQIQEEHLTPFGSLGRKTYSFGDVQQILVQAKRNFVEFFSVEVKLQSRKPLLSVCYTDKEPEARAEAEKLGQLLGRPVILLETKKSDCSDC